VDFPDVVTRIEAALSGPLPGAAAHALMAPRPTRDWPPGFRAEHARRAAGLVLMIPVVHRPHIVLTLRAHTLDRHGGQVSLPGGVIEPDETAEQAALREAHEEIGLSITAVRSLGALTPIDIPVSGFRLYPIVAVAAERPDLRPSDGEVAQILEPSLDELMDPGGIVWRTLTRDGRTLDFPAFVASDVEIWGATAMVVAEFLALLGWKGPPSSPRVENRADPARDT
jgi:8-oxo-dGTP pyrophosphatase MutT (NUDIX family)